MHVKNIYTIKTTDLYNLTKRLDVPIFYFTFSLMSENVFPLRLHNGGCNPTDNASFQVAYSGVPFATN
jgi:hypothetical protein